MDWLVVLTPEAPSSLAVWGVMINKAQEELACFVMFKPNIDEFIYTSEQQHSNGKNATINAH